jgi:hypothetical protein
VPTIVEETVPLTIDPVKPLNEESVSSLLEPQDSPDAHDRNLNNQEDEPDANDQFIKIED